MLKKRLLLAVIIVVPMTLYMLSLIISGEVNFRTLATMAPGPGHAESSIPSYSLTQSNGNTWTEDSLQGKVVIASFFFASCPSICPAMNFHLKAVHDRMSAYKDVVFVSYTVDPLHDTPAVLANYKSELGVGDSDKWTFLTGDRELIYEMATAYYLAASQDSNAEGGYSHSQSAVLIDWEGVMRTRIQDDGNPLGAYDVSEAYLVDELIDDVRVLVKEYRKVKMQIN